MELNSHKTAYISNGLNQLAADIVDNPDNIKEIINGRQRNIYKVNIKQLKRLYDEYIQIIRATG